MCVVGIGASAGGFDAISAFLRAMPVDAGLAYVVIQHLSPTQKSLSVELFAKRTTMPVQPADEGVPLEPNHVYIVPGTTYLHVANGVLRLVEPTQPRGQRLPIDDFFRSLAEDQKERAIGIVLSGTGADGTLGIRQIALNGGIALAQEPSTAQFDGMPRSAINTGMVTHVLPVAQMPEALIAYARHPYVRASEQPIQISEGDSASLRSILDLIRSQHGYNFHGYKQRMLLRRIQRRMGLRHIDRMAEYAAALRKDPREVDALFKDLLIGVTEFFRDPDGWKALSTEALEPLIGSKKPGEPIRVWVTGAATGEEAYTLAILLVEKMRELRKICPLQIFATDTNEEAIAFARASTYPAGITATVTAARLARFFVETKEDHCYQVARELRDTVVFGVQNLFSDPPFSRMDLVTCRNLMIYLEPELQRRVISLFHFALRPDGYLYLGPAETAGGRDDLFKLVSRKWRIYRRIGNAPREPVEWQLRPGETTRTPPAAATTQVPPRPPSLPAVVAQQMILERFAPASVLVNRHMEVVYFSGPTERYLIQPRGAPTNDLLTLARDGLRAHLRSGLRRAHTSGQVVEITDLRVRRGKTFEPVRISIAPAPGADDDGRLMLVVFQEEARPPASGKNGRGADAELVRQLEEEVRATKDDLQTTVERLETSNEELRVSNEEVVSINEELQSVNEELESSKEELQSLNEELNTVNQQLHNKLAELEGANNDLRNLLASSDIATICLDREMCIKWFTPATRHALNLLQTDVGRPIGDLGSPLAGESLLADARNVLERLAPIQTEVKSEHGRWYMRRTLPYRTEDDRIDGVIAVYSDITETRQVINDQQALTETLAQQVDDGTRAMRALAIELGITEDRERVAIARDLHDNLGQALYLAGLKIETARRAAEGQGKPSEALAEAGRQVEQAALRVRSLLFQLSPPVLDELGIASAIRWLADDMRENYNLTVDVTGDGADKPIGRSFRTILFRVVRELLINVAKHAHAAAARVHLAREDSALRITVEDDGVGFDLARIKGHKRAGLGLLAVRDRMSYLGGHAEITTAPGKGTKIALLMPLGLDGEADRKGGRSSDGGDGIHRSSNNGLPTGGAEDGETAS
jgi:two-component system CheB/CheR fusion protein